MECIGLTERYKSDHFTCELRTGEEQRGEKRDALREEPLHNLA